MAGVAIVAGVATVAGVAIVAGRGRRDRGGIARRALEGERIDRRTPVRPLEITA